MLALESLGANPLTISFGDHGDRVTPVPIPNTEVKPVSADGTWGEIPWESRTSPDFLVKRRWANGPAPLAVFIAVRWWREDSGVASCKCRHHSPVLILLDVHRLAVLARVRHDQMAVVAQAAVGQPVVMTEAILVRDAAIVLQVDLGVANEVKAVVLAGVATPVNGGQIREGAQIRAATVIVGRANVLGVVHPLLVGLRPQECVGMGRVVPV